MSHRPIRVLVVDDSAVVRRAIREILLRDPHVGAVETAVNGAIALRKLDRFDPDVVTMDVEMPQMDGLATLRHIMTKSPRPVIMLSGHTYEGAAKTIRALELGAVDFIQKPGGSESGSMGGIARRLITKIRTVAQARTRTKTARLSTQDDATTTFPVALRGPRRGLSGVVAIGASTGGTQAIRAIVASLPASFALPVLVVQHMPQDFTRAFAARLDETCALEVKEAAHRDLVRTGRVLVAPGHSHMVAHSEDGMSFVELNRNPAVSGHRPSVDVLFESVAAVYGPRAVAVLLTGMGKDGATGMRRIHDCGGVTLAQDEATSVIFGMPKAAIQQGGVQHVVPLDEVAERLAALSGGAPGEAR